jgi:hypothetical protein
MGGVLFDRIAVNTNKKNSAVQNMLEHAKY